MTSDFKSKSSFSGVLGYAGFAVVGALVCLFAGNVLLGLSLSTWRCLSGLPGSEDGGCLENSLQVPITLQGKLPRIGLAAGFQMLS